MKYIDIENIFTQLNGINSEDKLVNFLDKTGVIFYDQDKNFVKDSNVTICGLGGILIRKKDEKFFLGDSNVLVDDYLKDIGKIKAIGGFMSYLNSGEKTTEEMCDILDKYGHRSTEHMIYLNILVTGISTSVENEFNSQRDLVHLSRVTEARTKVQVKPPYVVLNESMIDFYKNVRDFNIEQLDRIDSDNKGNHFYEETNLLHSSAKATGVILSGSLRNFKKLTSDKDDDGKEYEFRRALKKIDNLVKDI